MFVPIFIFFSEVVDSLIYVDTLDTAHRCDSTMLQQISHIMDNYLNAVVYLLPVKAPLKPAIQDIQTRHKAWSVEVFVHKSQYSTITKSSPFLPNMIQDCIDTRARLNLSSIRNRLETTMETENEY